MGREFDGILRISYLIDENGKIEHVFGKVKTKTHGDDVLAALWAAPQPLSLSPHPLGQPVTPEP